MAETKDTQQEQPSVETVKEGLSLSDFLTIEVCNPIKEQLDKIEVCLPNIKSTQSRILSKDQCDNQDKMLLGISQARDLAPFHCPPFVDPPRRPCFPDCFPNCSPNCLPNSYSSYFEMSRDRLLSPSTAPSQDKTETQELIPEMQILIEKIEGIKADINDLKKKLP